MFDIGWSEMAVIMLVAVGNGSSVAVQRQIQSLGTNTLIVNRQAGFGPAAGGRSRTGTLSRPTDLTMKDVAALRDKSANPDVKAVAPTLMAQSVTGAYRDATYAPAQFIGTKYTDAQPATKTVQFTRPICLHPAVARYKGSGDPNDASNFACVR